MATEPFDAQVWTAQAMGAAMARQMDWQLYLLGPEVAAARREWQAKLTALEIDLRQGVRAAFVEIPPLPGPYHVFRRQDAGEHDDASTMYVFSVDNYDYLTDGSVRIGTVSFPEQAEVLAYDPDRKGLILVGWLDGDEWQSAALTDRYAHADEIAHADLKEQEPELYARAFPPYPTGQTVRIPKLGNLATSDHLTEDV
jgi:hypothetical protein